jgi:hypothetical protein
MGTIQMSSALVSQTASHFMMNNQSTSGTSFPIAARGMLVGHAQSAGETGARLAIMRGAVPIDFSTLTSFSARSADALVVYDATGFTGGGTNNFIGAQDVVNPIIVTTLYRNCTQAGTATWFWWFTTNLSGFNVFNNAQLPFNQIVGTVGSTGSGADLEYPSANFVLGEQYRIFNLRIQFPTSWTY